MRTYADAEYGDHDVEEYVDIVSGTATSSEEYDRLVEDIDSGVIDRVVVDEISRLSRLGGGDVLEFIQHCLDNNTSVEDCEVGLTIDVTDDIIDQAVTELLVGAMGQLPKIEHKQKMRRIQSGIRAAQDAGKWTGRPPMGFTVEDGYLRVEPEEFLRVREGVERVVAGESTVDVMISACHNLRCLGWRLNDENCIYVVTLTTTDWTRPSRRLSHFQSRLRLANRLRNVSNR